MPSIIVHVNADPLSTPAHLSAIRFFLACQAEKLDVPMVFFSGDAVRIAISPTVPRSAADDLANQWAKIAARSNTQLSVCTSAAVRRGVIPPDEAEVRQWHSNWHPAFYAGSLADLSQMLAEGAKLIRFGD